MAKKNKGTKQKDEMMIKKQRQSLISMYFHRYLMIRYFLAAFFFANFFWIVLSWGSWSVIIPIILLLLCIFPAFQLGLMFGKTKVNLTLTKWFYRIQWLVCIMMMVLAWTAPMDQIFPAFTDTISSRALLFCVFLIGFIMSSLVLRKFYLIDHNKDKQYGRIQFFETKYGIKLDPNASNL